MAGFDSGAFDSGAFDTLLGPLRSRRLAAEALGTFVEARSRRLVAEALSTLPVGVPRPTLTTQRTAVEAIGWMSSFAGRKLSAQRSITEVLGTAGEQHLGLQLPGVSTSANTTVYLAFEPDTSIAGFLGLLDPYENGFRVSWEAGATAGTLAWRYGIFGGSSTVTFGPGVTVVSLSIPYPFTFTELGLSRPYGYSGGGTVHELAVFNAYHNGTVRSQVKTYLDEKWNQGGPVTFQDLCAALVPGPAPEGWALSLAYGEEPEDPDQWIAVFDSGLIFEKQGSIDPDDGHGGVLIITPGVVSSGTDPRTTLIWAGNASEGFTTAHLSWNGQSVSGPVTYTAAAILPGFDGYYVYQTNSPVFPINEAPDVPVIVRLE